MKGHRYTEKYSRNKGVWTVWTKSDCCLKYC